MDALQGKVDLIDGEVRHIGDALREYLDSGTTPARKVKPPGTKAGRELLQHLLGRLEQVSSHVSDVRKWTTGLTPLPTGPDTPLSYGSPVTQQSQSPPSQTRDAPPRDTPPTSSSTSAAPPQPQQGLEQQAAPQAPQAGLITAPVLSRPLAFSPPEGILISTVGPLLSDHASPLFTCTYRDINILHEELFEQFSRHPIVRDRGYFKLRVQDLPPLNVEKMARPTKDHATSFCYKTDSRGLIKVDTGKRVNFKTPKLPFPRSSKIEWSFEEQQDLWNSTARSPPKGTQPYIIGNPLFEDVELSPGEKLLSRGRTKLEGINTQYVYFNLTGKTITTMHREDAHVRSENLLRSGANKFWCFVKPSSTAKMEEQLKRLYPTMRDCSQCVRHLSLHIPPFQLDAWGVEYTLDYCIPGQAIVTEPGTYHQVLNAGPNYAIAINVEYLSSPDFPIDYTFCDDHCPDKFAMSPEDFLIYPKTTGDADSVEEQPKGKQHREGPWLEGSGELARTKHHREGPWPEASEKEPLRPQQQREDLGTVAYGQARQASKGDILQTPVPLPKGLPRLPETTLSDRSLAENTGRSQPPQAATQSEPRAVQPIEQPSTNQTEPEPRAPDGPTRQHLLQPPIPQTSLPIVTNRPQSLPRSRETGVLSAAEAQPVTDIANQPQSPLQQPVATQAEPMAGSSVVTARRAQVLAHPAAESQFHAYQQFQSAEVSRLSEPRRDWAVSHPTEQLIPPRPVTQKNPFSQPRNQSSSVPSLPPTPIYTSEQFQPYSNQASPAPSPFQQEFFPTPHQNPELYRPGGGYSPKPVQRPSAYHHRALSPPNDRVAQAAAVLASLPHGSPAVTPILSPPPASTPPLAPAPILSPAAPTQLSPKVVPASGLSLAPPQASPTVAPASGLSLAPPQPSPIVAPAPEPLLAPPPALPAPPKSKKRSAGAAPVKRATKKQRSEGHSVPAPGAASREPSVVTPVPVPVFGLAARTSVGPIAVPEVAQSASAARSSIATPASLNRAAYQNLASMMVVQGDGRNRVQALTAGLTDSPATRKASFQRLDRLVKEWRMISISSIFPEGQYHEFINKVDEMDHFNTPIHIFLRRLIRMKMAVLYEDIRNNAEVKRLDAIEHMNNLLLKLKWPDTETGKLQHYIREGKCWNTLCGNEEGLLCIMPLDTNLSDLAMFQEEVTRLHSQLKNPFINALANIGKQLITAIWEGKELAEFVWENFNTDDLSPTEILPLLHPYANITLRRNHYNPKELENAPMPENWSPSYPWPADPAAIRHGNFCNFCKRKKGCQCTKKRMPDVPRIEIDGPKGLGIWSRGEHEAGEWLGELLGDLVAVGSHPNEWTFELRRPDMDNELVAEIYPGRRGNWVRKVNHSENPTAAFVVVKMSGRWRVVLELLRDVRDGEEITAMYGRGYEKGSQSRVGGGG